MASPLLILWPGLCLLLLAHLPGTEAQGAVEASCGRIAANNNLDADDKQFLCKLYQQAAQLEQLGAAVTDSLDRLAALEPAGDEEGRAKRKHEYLRFGKRKHEYLRFGKRKHEYLRFGRK